MKLPEGTRIGLLKATLDEAIPYTAAFCGALEVTAEQGKGFLLVDRGTITAAYLNGTGGSFRGRSALVRLAEEPSPEFGIRKYTPEEYVDALSICSAERLLVPEEPGATDTPPRILDEGKMRKILGQPGIRAVSAFFEGFAVQSLGDADFDQVAALAEDLLRAGTKIAADMRIGMLDQIILETVSGKIVIAPYGDLYLCVLADADTNLGLIRVALKGLQSEVN